MTARAELVGEAVSVALLRESLANSLFLLGEQQRKIDKLEQLYSETCALVKELDAANAELFSALLLNDAEAFKKKNGLVVANVPERPRWWRVLLGFFRGR